MKTTKSGLIVGAAVACAILQGCKAPKPEVREYMAKRDAPQQQAPVTVSPAPEPVSVVPAPAPEPVPVGKSVEKPSAKKATREAEYLEYTIRNGDYLAKIAKRHNVKQSAILAANPGLKADRIYAGRKIRIPVHGDVKAVPNSSAPESAAVKAPRKAAGRVAYKPYTGATKEYVVKTGDYVGKIAMESGISVRALKELNGLTKNDIRVGQKLKVPAEKQIAPVKAAAPATAKKAADAKNPADAKKSAEAGTEMKPAEKKEISPVVTPTEPAPVTTPGAEATAVSDAAPAPQKDAPAVKPAVPAAKPAPTTHKVREGEDLFSIAIGYGVSPSALKDANNLNDTDQIPVGTVLKLPAGAKAQQ